MNKKRFLILIPLIFTIILSNVMVTYGVVDYSLLIKPIYAPAKWLFVLIWSIIYIVLYITTFKAIKDKEKYKNILMQFYGVLLFHLIWIFFFFVCNFQLLSIIMLIAIYIISISFIFTLAKQNKKLLYPNLIYIIWLLYALLINISVYFLN